jgi:hypothetical protein
MFCNTTEPIGRYQLGEELELGGGSVRSLIRFLRTQGLIEPVDRQGHQLSNQGKHQCSNLKQILIELVTVPPSSFTVDIENVACQLRNVAHRLTDGLTQRDAAIQAGASGATTFYQDSNPEILIMPVDHELMKTDLGTFLTPFTFQPGDVLIIGSAPTRMAAQLGALAAALTLLEK